MSWVLDPATHVVGVQWGGFKFSISASSLLQWRSPEQTRPQIGAPTVSGQFIGSINLLGGAIAIPHPEDPRIILASSEGAAREESSEEGTDEICVARRYQLFYYFWTGNPGDYAPTVYFRDEFAVFDTPEAAQAWADGFVEDWNWILRFGAWPLECVQTEQRPWQAFTASGGVRYVMAPSPGHPAKDRGMSVTPSTTNPDGFIVHLFNGDWRDGKDYVKERLGRGKWEPSPPIGEGAIERMDRAHTAGRGRRVVATYDYTDENGELLFQTVRFDPKDFRQRRPDPARPGSWIGNLDGVRRVPYRLPDLLAAAHDTVLVVEGEKDADRLTEAGFVATSSPCGAKSWKPELNQWFDGRVVHIIADNDQPGREHAQQVAENLHGIAREVRVVELGLPEKGGDVSDWLDAGNDPAALLEICTAAPLWEPGAVSQPQPTPPPAPWPTMAPEAYHGLLGEIVNTLRPHSESDPVAILIQALVCAGNVIGRTGHYVVEGDRHHANLFAVLVGDSSKGRKGTALGRVKSIVKHADDQWTSDRIKGGLSSGEGFINEVRDEVKKYDPKSGEWQVTEPGIADKRMLIVEPEFASALAVADRHGNTLSPLIRKAWDGDKLASMTRSSPLTATGAHISIIGHITADEARARVNRTEMANGFCNRFLFCMVRRSQNLPFGGSLSDKELLRLGEMFKEAVDKAGEIGRVTIATSARGIWAKAYDALSEGQPGLLGAITARSEAQTIRLAMLYALLDGSSEIEEPHLRAGLAIWEYCEASAVHIFGNALGDPVADEILTALRQAGAAGMARNAIRDMFGRHKSSDRIGAALDMLARRGMARMAKQPTGGGRPTEMWFATDGEARR
jgi:hypothetical protein